MPGSDNDLAARIGAHVAVLHTDPAVRFQLVADLVGLAEPHRVALAAHAILLSIIGVPAIYFHSLFGSSHDIAGMESSGINRRINRQQLDADALLAALETSPRRRDTFAGLTRMLRVRSAQPAFDPFSAQRVLGLGTAVFAVQRGEGSGSVVAVINVSGSDAEVAGVAGTDLLTGERHNGDLALPADGFVWLAQD